MRKPRPSKFIQIESSRTGIHIPRLSNWPLTPGASISSLEFLICETGTKMPTSQVTMHVPGIYTVYFVKYTRAPHQCYCYGYSHSVPCMVILMANHSQCPRPTFFLLPPYY